MTKLLLLEWMKVRKYRTFWAFLILFGLTLTGVNYILHSMQMNAHNVTQGQLNVHLFNFPGVWSTTAWASGFSVLLLGLLLIVLITNEYTYKTHRQQVIDGLSRSQFITAKWLIVVIFIILTWLLYVILTCLLGESVLQESVLDGFHYAGYFLIKVALSLSVAFMFAIWLKRAGLAIGLYLAYVLLLEGIIGHFLNKIVNGMGDFLPLAASGNLVSNPLRQLVPGIESEHIPAIWLVMTCMVYIVLFVCLSYRYIQRTDL